MTEKKTEERSTEETEKSLEDTSLKIIGGGPGCTIRADIDIFYSMLEESEVENFATYADWKEKQGYIVLLDQYGVVYLIRAKKVLSVKGGLTREEFLGLAGEGRWLPESE